MKRQAGGRRLEQLESRQLLATIADGNWSGTANESIAAAQGPTVVQPRTIDTYRVEGTVGAGDANDYFALRPAVAGTLAIAQTSWLTGATPNWILSNAAGATIAQKGATAPISVAANTTVYFRVVGATGSQYYSWDVELTAGTQPPVGQQPFGGTAWPVPGQVEAENYDVGGPAIAYNDTSPENLGNTPTYRPGDQVDTGTAESNLAIGYIEPGEWVEYTVNVSQAGTYRADFRVGSGAGGGSLRMEVGTTNLTGSVSFGGTGSWTAYTTVGRNVTLAAGQQVIRITFESAPFNFNWFSITRVNNPDPPIDTQGGVPTERLGRIGKGITVSRWFWTPSNNDPFPRTGQSDFMSDGEIRALYRLGFRNIRLLVGADNWMSGTGNTQGDYDYAFRTFRGNFQQNWYETRVPAAGAARDALYAKWNAIRNTVSRITSVANAAKTSPSDTNMLVTIVPYEVASTLEFGPYGGDTREPLRTNRFNNFAGFWQQFAAALVTGPTALTADQVVFETMNEPSFFNQNNYWRDQQRKIINAIRVSDPGRNFTIIASGPSGRVDAIGDVRGLIGYDIEAADKGNVVYNVKFYEPGDVASQGAKNLRASDFSYVGWMHSLPWPSSAAAVSSIIPGYTFNQPYNSSVAGYSTFINNYYNKYPWFYTDGPRTPQQVADSIFAYGYGIDASESIPGYAPGSGYGASFVRGRAQQLAEWRTREQVPVVISEVGANASYASFSSAAAYGDGVNNDPRSQYLIDVKAALDANNLGWMLWGYDDQNAFGVARAQNIAGTVEADRQVPLNTLRDAGRLITNADGTLNLARLDRDVLAALGLQTTISAAAATAPMIVAGTLLPTTTRRSGAGLFGEVSIL
jgi:hypothetical protein